MLYIVSMGFALWIEGDRKLAQGLHEYRPMGVAVVAVTDHFRQRDFRPAVEAPSRDADNYVGLFASLVELNAWDQSQPKRRAPIPPWL